MNGMTIDDVEIVEFPYPDDWYDKPEMLQVNMNNPSELWLRRDHKHDLAFRPLETALENGTVDAIYTQSKVFQHLQEATGKFKAIEDLSRYPDWTLQMANCPAVITCTDVMADEHPELVVAYMKAMIKVGRWANDHKHAAAVILNRQTFYRDAEDTYQGIKDVDMVPNLSPQNLASIEIGKDFMLATATSSVTSTCTNGPPRSSSSRPPSSCSKRSGQMATTAKLPGATDWGSSTAGSDSATRESTRALISKEDGGRGRSHERRHSEHPETREGERDDEDSSRDDRRGAAQVENVSPQGRRRTGRRGRAVLVDVREAEEWQHGHIDGSVPHREDCSSSSPIRQAPATRRHSTQPAGSSWCARPAPAPHSPRSR